MKTLRRLHARALLLLALLLLALLRAAASPDDQHEPQTPEQPLRPPTGRPLRRVYDPVSGLFCELAGDCHACPASEKDEAYCRETGSRQEMRCPRTSESTSNNHKKTTPGDDDEASLPEVRFRACVPVEKENPAKSVLVFELVMAASLAAAYVLLRREQQKHMSSFDLRKDPRQRGALLGGPAGAGGQKGAD